MVLHLKTCLTQRRETLSNNDQASGLKKTQGQTGREVSSQVGRRLTQRPPLIITLK